MASPDHQALSARARALAERHPAAREPLLFYAELILLPADAEAIRKLAAAKAPPPLASFARRHSGAELCPDAPRLDDPASPAGWFARVLLRARGGFTPPASPSPNACPRCGRPPQAGCLRRHGDGSALSLICSLCLEEWQFPRGRCPACGDTKLAYYTAEQFPHVVTQACEACRRYLHLIDLAKDPQAIPEADELAALPMDVWARQQGFVKIHPNLAGI